MCLHPAFLSIYLHFRFNNKNTWRFYRIPFFNSVSLYLYYRVYHDVHALIMVVRWYRSFFYVDFSYVIINRKIFITYFFSFFFVPFFSFPRASPLSLIRRNQPSLISRVFITVHGHRRATTGCLYTDTCLNTYAYVICKICAHDLSASCTLRNMQVFPVFEGKYEALYGLERDRDRIVDIIQRIKKIVLTYACISYFSSKWGIDTRLTI